MRFTIGFITSAIRTLYEDFHTRMQSFFYQSFWKKMTVTMRMKTRQVYANFTCYRLKRLFIERWIHNHTKKIHFKHVYFAFLFLLSILIVCLQVFTLKLNLINVAAVPTKKNCHNLTYWNVSKFYDYLKLLIFFSIIDMPETSHISMKLHDNFHLVKGIRKLFLSKTNRRSSFN